MSGGKYNACPDGFRPKQVWYDDFIILQTGRYALDDKNYVYLDIKKVGRDKLGSKRGTGHGSAVPLHIEGKYGQGTDVRPLVNSDVVNLPRCKTKKKCKDNNRYLETGTGHNTVVFSNYYNQTRNWSVTKVGGYDYPDDKNIYYGDTVRLTSPSKSTGKCNGNACTGDIACIDYFGKDNDCHYLGGHGKYAIDHGDKTDTFNMFRIYNLQGNVPCEETEKKCDPDKCPPETCATPGVCIDGSKATCDPDDGSWSCACSDDSDCPSGKVCDSDSKSCKLKEGSKCVTDNDCESVGHRFCREGLCIDCLEDDDCESGDTCSSGFCQTPKTSPWGFILLIVFILAALGLIFYLYRRYKKKRRLNDTQSLSRQQKQDNLYGSLVEAVI